MWILFVGPFALQTSSLGQLQTGNVESLAQCHLPNVMGEAEPCGTAAEPNRIGCACEAISVEWKHGGWWSPFVSNPNCCLAVANMNLLEQLFRLFRMGDQQHWLPFNQGTRCRIESAGIRLCRMQVWRSLAKCWKVLAFDGLNSGSAWLRNMMIIHLDPSLGKVMGSMGAMVGSIHVWEPILCGHEQLELILVYILVLWSHSVLNLSNRLA